LFLFFKFVYFIQYNNDINRSCNIFYDKMNYAFNLATTTKNVGSRYKRIKEWMTAGLLCSARKKQHLSMKIKKHSNNTSLMLCYIKSKNTFTKILRFTKIHFSK
jgi:hypothetical protein